MEKKKRVVSDEERRRRSEATKRMWAEGRLGPHTISEKHRESARRTCIERNKTPLSLESRQKISNSLKGIPWSSELRQSMAKAKSDPTYRKLQAEKAAAALEKMPRRLTKPEVKMRQWLLECSVEFIFQFRLGKYTFDFKVGSALIEVDGVFWHSLPENKLRDVQKETLAASKGYRLIRITDSEIENGMGWKVVLNLVSPDCFAKYGA